MLTEQQVTYFNLFGYLALPGLFVDDMDEISRVFDELFDDPNQLRLDSDSSPFIAGPRDVLPAMVNLDPVLAQIVADRRILDIADALLTEGHSFLPGDGSRFRSETTWHIDAPTQESKDKPHIKMALYLDPLDEESGALRVIPGSHHVNDVYTGQLRKEIMGNKASSSDTLGEDGPSLPCKLLKSEPGDLLVWDRRIAHASYNSTFNRRVLSFGFKSQ